MYLKYRKNLMRHKDRMLDDAARLTCCAAADQPASEEKVRERDPRTFGDF